MNAVSTLRAEEYIATMVKAKPYVMQLQNNQAVDGLGRVTALVNVQSIIETAFEETPEQLIDCPPIGAVMPVVYVEEIPTIYGSPIWEKLEGEDVEAYELFKKYRSMEVDDKTRRSIFKLSADSKCSIKNLELLRQNYHWSIRAHAFDVYKQQERELVLQLRQQEIEGRHAETAKQLYDKATQYLLKHEDMLTPKTAIQMLETAAKLERLSAGMADGRRNTYGTEAPAINITNNLGDKAVAESQNTVITQSVDQNKERLMQVLNIMNSIGALKQEDTIVDVEVEDI